MTTLFLGLTAANLIALLIAFALGFVSIQGDEPSAFYARHLLIGLTSGLLCALTHVSVFTYFMATSKWLQAATEKAALKPQAYVIPSLVRKGRALRLAMTAILITIVMMVAGAGADPTINPLWPSNIHLVLAVAAIIVNCLCAMGEYRLIAEQARLMDQAAMILGRASDVSIKNVTEQA